MRQILSVLPSLIAIACSAGLGVMVSHTIVVALGFRGALAIAATLLISMFMAFVFFALGTTVQRVVGLKKTEK